MKAVLVVAADKFTGAAAVAEHWCRALHIVGFDATLVFRPGRNLETRLAGSDWALPILKKERGPLAVRANARRLREICARADFVISFLPHDHVLCHLAGLHRSTILVRSLRRSKHLTSRLFQRILAPRVAACLPANSAIADALRDSNPSLETAVIPVPVEGRFFDHGEVSQPWRKQLGIPAGALVVGIVGKLAKRRGFLRFIEVVNRLDPRVHAVVTGIGEAQEDLERQIQVHGLGGRVHLIGYQDEELPSVFRLLDLLLVLAPGSDHGHRVISEAQASGCCVVAAAFPGVADLIEHQSNGIICRSSVLDVACIVSDLLEDRPVIRRLADRGQQAVRSRDLASAGRQLGGFLDRLKSEA